MGNHTIIMTDSAVDDVDIDTDEWYKSPVDDVKSISESGILTNQSDGILILYGTPVQYVSKKAGSWVSADDKISVQSVDFLRPDTEENLFLLAYKTSDREHISDIYTKDTDIKKTDKSLQNSSFTGFIEVSKDSISGTHFIFYNDGMRRCLSITSSGNRITGDASFDRATKHVGIYSVYKVEFEDIDFSSDDNDDSTRESEYDKDDRIDESREDEENAESEIEEQEGVIIDQGKEQEFTRDDIEVIKNRLESIESKIDSIVESDTEIEKNENSTDLQDDVLRNVNISIQKIMSSNSGTDDDVRLVPQVSNRRDIDDDDLEEYVRFSDHFMAIEWIIKDLSLTLHNESSPKLPGVVSMVRDSEQVSLFESLDGYEYDAVFYSRNGKPRGCLDIYTTESQVTLNMIEKSLDEIGVEPSENEIFCYIGISRTGYEPGIKSSMDEKKLDGGIIRSEDRDAIFSKNGEEFHVCLVEQHSSDFFLYYPDN